MSSRRAFIDLCVEGKVAPDNIDDFVDQWHETPGGIALHDHLGMTLEEYSLWMRVPDALPYIIKTRQERKSLTDVVINECQNLHLVRQGDEKLKIERLQKWLKAKGELI